jgi:hypothetical protein
MRRFARGKSPSLRRISGGDRYQKD